jgi:hypothetical protein
MSRLVFRRPARFLPPPRRLLVTALLLRGLLSPDRQAGS